MKYALLTITILVLVASVWVINDRANKSVQEIIDICNDRYEKDTKSNQAYRVDNSESVRNKERCLADAHQSADSDKRWGIATIAVGMIVSFVLYVARRKTLV